ncbi:MAG: hypothetical protein ACYC7E_06150 [Armatimonadota bacterium]
MADPDMLFHLTLKDADIHAVLDDIFTQAGRTFVIEDALTGKITVHADDLEFREALALILPTGYTVQEIGGIYHIRRIARLAS